MNARKILCLMAAVLMLSGCSKGVDGSQASSKAAESSGKTDSSVSDYDNTTTEPETDKPEFDLNDSVIGFSQESGFYFDFPLDERVWLWYSVCTSVSGALFFAHF